MLEEHVSLARQVDLALEKLGPELTGMSAGTIVLQVRNDEIGKFGIRHLPMDCVNPKPDPAGMNSEHVRQLRHLAVKALQHKKGWTHGEIAYDFVLRQGSVHVSVQFESNYNMANLLIRRAAQRQSRRGASNE